MNRQPTTIEEVAQLLSSASKNRQKIGAVDLSALKRILEHTPEDLTVSVQAGITLAELQAALGKHRQWLPIDPPHPEEISIRELLDRNLSGPRRFGHGTIRDHLIGITVAMADGTIVHSGGKVVKNVAGYDLMKLFIGAQGSLGVIVEATFKLRPQPDVTELVQSNPNGHDATERLIEKISQSPVTPVVMDLVSAESGAHRDSSAKSSDDDSPSLPRSGGEGGGTCRAATPGSQREPFHQAGEINTPLSGSFPARPSRGEGEECGAEFRIVLGFAGTREEVEWQLEQVKELGFTETGSLDHEQKFWSDPAPVQRLSVLPSKLMETVRGLDAPFIARAGNGIIYHRGPAKPVDRSLPWELMRRVKDTYDPHHIFPDMPHMP